MTADNTATGTGARRGVGLQVQAAAAILGLAALVLGGTALVLHTRLSADLLAQLTARGRSEARVLASVAGEAVAAGDALRLAALVDQARREDPGLYSAAVTDAKGIVLAHFVFSRVGQPYALAGQVLVEKNEAAIIRRYALGGQDALDFEAPVRVSVKNDPLPQTVGAVHLVYSLEPIALAAAATGRTVFAVAVVVFALALVCVLWWVGGVRTVLRQLTRAAAAAGSGQADLQRPVRRGDELGQLADAFYHMLDTLGQTESSDLAKQEQDLARHFQAWLTPKAAPQVAGYSVGLLGRAAGRIGGSYCDFIELGKGRWGVAMAEVSTPGVPGVVALAQVRSALRGAAAAAASPAAAVSQVNLQLQDDLAAGLSVSLAYLVLDAAKRSVTLVCAGERPVVVYRHATRTCERVLPDGPALGTAAPAVFDRKLTEAGVKLAPGDFLLCATSGVDGAVNAQQEAFGVQRLIETLRSAAGFAAQGIAEMVERAVQAFAGSAPQPHDLALILIKPEGSDRA